MKRTRGPAEGRGAYFRPVEGVEALRGENFEMSGMVVPMSMLPPGARAIVREIRAGRGLARRLMEMGLLPGSEVTILFNSAGPLVISVRGVTLSLGRGIASKVMVQPL